MSYNIRSQNKRSIMEAREIWIPDDNLKDIMASPGGSNERYEVVGSFTTEEEAMEVLNDIYEWIARGAIGVYQIGGE